MSRRNCSHLARIVSAVLLAALPLGAFDIVLDGTPAATVVTADEPTAIVSDAVACLTSYIEKISGARLSVVPESRADGVAGNLVVVGETRLAVSAGIDTSAINADGYVHRVVGRKLFVVGPDADFSARIKDSDKAALHALYDLAERGIAWKGVLQRRGTLNAVIGLLRDHCGVRWLLPTPKGELVPAAKTISVPDALDRTAEPAFVCGFARNSTERDPRTRIWVYTPGNYWAAANGFRIPMSFLFIGGHSWYTQIRIFGAAPEALFTEHPEYFAVWSSQRALGRHGYNSVLCTANPEVVDLLTVTMRELFDQGWDMVQYNQSDGYSRCKCVRCEALDPYRGYLDGEFPEPCDRLFQALERVAARCLASHPGKRILALSYGPTKLPSARVARWPDNVVFQAAHTEPADFERWRGKGSIYAAWLYWLGPYYAPGVSVKCTPRAAAERLRLYHANGIRALYWGMGCAGENWGNEGPVYYVIGQLLRDLDASVDQLVREYCHGVYGRAGPAMERYFDCLYKRLDSHFLLREDANDMKADEFWPAVYSAEVLDELGTHLDSARRLADDDASRMWLALTLDQFTHLKTTAVVYHRYRDVLLTPTMPALQRLKAAVAERERYLSKLQSYDRDTPFVTNWYPGYAGFAKFAALGRKNRPQLGAPFTWSFDDLPGLLKRLQSDQTPVD